MAAVLPDWGIVSFPPKRFLGKLPIPDAPVIRQKFRKQIRENEYDFTFAQNGVEALMTIAVRKKNRKISKKIPPPTS